MIEKDANDLPVLALNNDRTVSVLTKVIDFLADGDAQIKADDYYGKYKDVWTEINVNSFIEGRALYYISPIETVKFMRGMEANFGILPLPKYDEAQDKYFNTMQYNNATVMDKSYRKNIDRDRRNQLIKIFIVIRNNADLF